MLRRHRLRGRETATPPGRSSPGPSAITLLLTLVACNGGRDERRVPDAGAAVAEPVDVALEDAGAAEALDAGAAAPVDPVALLKAGQAHAAKLEWAEAIAALDQAGAAGDVAALEELAFQAVLTGDDRRATRAAQAVIDAPAIPDKRRATAYYHLGRAAELRGDLDAARAAYTQASALDARSTFADRLKKLGARPALPVPASPPCAALIAPGELCGCLHAALAPPPVDPAAPAPTGTCVTSHRHGSGAYAITAVGRQRSPTYLVATVGKKVRALARLDDDTGELTVRRWTIERGDTPVVRVDAELGARDASGKLRAARARTLVCTLGAAPRCLAEVPSLAKVGTPSTTRKLFVELDAGVLHVTVIAGPTSPSDVLGSHRLW